MPSTANMFCPLLLLTFKVIHGVIIHVTPNGPAVWNGVRDTVHFIRTKSTRENFLRQTKEVIETLLCCFQVGFCKWLKTN